MHHAVSHWQAGPARLLLGFPPHRPSRLGGWLWEGWGDCAGVGMGAQVTPCSAGDELEQIRPSVYRNVARQLHLPLHSEAAVTDAFLAVAAHIFAAGASSRHTWARGSGAAVAEV